MRITRYFTFAVIAGALFTADPARADEQCLKCDELFIDTVEAPYYTHRFDSTGEAFRRCNTMVGGHNGCHNQWELGSCSSHSNCVNLFAVVEINNLVNARHNGTLSEPQFDAAIVGVPMARYMKEGGIVTVVNCSGDVVARWTTRAAITPSRTLIA